MKVKTLLCNCGGQSESFQSADMNTLPSEIEAHLDVDYAIVHPQLCGQGGNEVLEDVLRSAGPNTYVVVGGCAPEEQLKLFKKVLLRTEFDRQRFVPMDIRKSTNGGILDRLRKRLEALPGLAKKPH